MRALLNSKETLQSATTNPTGISNSDRLHNILPPLQNLDFRYTSPANLPSSFPTNIANYIMLSNSQQTAEIINQQRDHDTILQQRQREAALRDQLNRNNMFYALMLSNQKSN
jgi:hypothetical protein